MLNLNSQLLILLILLNLFMSFFVKFGLIKQDLDNTIKQINVTHRDIASIKSRVNEINDAVIVSKINNKQTNAKTKSNKQ